jgi:hypothetical protein
MTMWELTDHDEGRHPAGTEELWGESWYLDWAAEDASYGGYVRLGLYPNLGKSWWWIALVGEGEPTVLVVDHDVPCPEGDGALTPSAGDTSVEVGWTMPMKNFHVKSRAKGVRLAQPADAFHGLEGEPVDVSVDLRWASVSVPFPYAMTTRYEISCDVQGTVTVGDRTIEVACAGQRDHSWGVRDWWIFPWNWTSGAFDDGRRMHGARSIIPELELFATGYTVSPDGALHEADAVVVEDYAVDDEALPAGAKQRIGPISFTTEHVGHAPILLVAPDGREARFPRAMCRYTTGDGVKGTGWTEFNWPPGWPQR